MGHDAFVQTKSDRVFVRQVNAFYLSKTKELEAGLDKLDKEDSESSKSPFTTQADHAISKDLGELQTYVWVNCTVVTRPRCLASVLEYMKTGFQASSQKNGQAAGPPWDTERAV